MSAPVQHTVPAPLHPLVSSAVGYRVPAHPAGVHRGLPSRHLTLVVELLAPLGVTGMEQPVSAHGVVGGLHTRAALIDAGRPQEGLQYGLTPLGARVLLGLPAGELRGRVVDLEDVVGALAPRLLDRAAGWGGHLGRTAIAPEVAEAWRLILARDGGVPIATVAAHVGWGRRHLAERFRLATGLTPKEAARVARFEKALRLLRTQRPPLAALAVAAGYADQPHLAREWRALTGVSMTTWVREELPFIQDDPARVGAHSMA